MRVMGADDPLPPNSKRILIAGTSGAGKTTFGNRLANMLDLPQHEVDSLHWGPGWIRRPSFLVDVAAVADSEAWVTEWQYRDARPILAQRAHVMIWLDYSVPRRMYWVTRRTVKRRVSRKPLWDSKLREQALLKFFTDESHIIRWAWRTRRSLAELPELIERQHPHIALYRFRSPTQTQRWLEDLKP